MIARHLRDAVEHVLPVCHLPYRHTFVLSSQPHPSSQSTPGRQGVHVGGGHTGGGGPHVPEVPSVPPAGTR